MRILVLLTDAFGGYGGIAQYNRDLLTALCSFPECKEVVAIPRLMPNDPEPMPENLQYLKWGLNSIWRYIIITLLILQKKSPFDLIISSHINLLPIAYLAKVITRAPLLLAIYGIDAWSPTRSKLANHLVNKINAFYSISEITKQRFLEWTKLTLIKGYTLPNAINLNSYRPGPKDESLLVRYGLKGKTILLTVGRLVSRERNKGFDEVLEVLPDLLLEIPNLIYIIAGTGHDQMRLRKKAQTLGIINNVVFTGYIPESDKAALYRIADVYVMPSRGEGFGFVFLEAMACGVPVVASKVDGSREAVRDGQLGILVDPSRPNEIKAGICQALSLPKGIVSEGLNYFSFDNFVQRLHNIVHAVCENRNNTIVN